MEKEEERLYKPGNWGRMEELWMKYKIKFKKENKENTQQKKKKEL